MEITDSTIGIFYLSKAFALAPLALHRNPKGYLQIKRSLIFTIYSLTLMLFLVFLTYRHLLFNKSTQIHVRASFRMQSATSNVVSDLDVSLVVFATVSGTFCGIFGLKSIQEFNARLRKIDESLHSYKHFKRDRIRSILTMTIPLLIITILLGADFWTWIYLAQDMDLDLEKNLQWYIPFYSLYFILTCLHILLANTAFGISVRYNRLNLVLKNNFLKRNKKEQPTSKKANINSILDPTLTAKTSIGKLAWDTSQFDSKCKSIIIRSMAENHESLSKCVAIVSSSNGIAMLLILTSCLLQLVATAYFLFLELLSKKDSGNVWLQVLWIMFHTFRLLMVVEPCHLATRESRRTIQIICDIENKVHDPIIVEEVKKFWQQLLVLDAKFSASGLCKVDRNILTSFGSAIATYLIILIQFQKTNG